MAASDDGALRLRFDGAGEVRRDVYYYKSGCLAWQTALSTRAVPADLAASGSVIDRTADAGLRDVAASTDKQRRICSDLFDLAAGRNQSTHRTEVAMRFKSFLAGFALLAALGGCAAYDD